MQYFFTIYFFKFIMIFVDECEKDKIFHIGKILKKEIFGQPTEAFHEFSPLIRGNGQLFLCLKEKVAKRSKNPCRIYRACHFCFRLKLLSPPRVEILLRQNLLGTTAHFRDLPIFRSLQNGTRQ